HVGEIFDQLDAQEQGVLIKLFRPLRIGVAEKIAQVVVALGQLLAVLGQRVVGVGLDELKQVLASLRKVLVGLFLFAELRQQFAQVVQAEGLFKAVLLTLGIGGCEPVEGGESLAVIGGGFLELIAAKGHVGQ